MPRSWAISRGRDEALDAAEVDERAELAHRRDRARHHLALLEPAKRSLAALTRFGLQEPSARQHDALAAVLDLRHQEGQCLTDEVGGRRPGAERDLAVGAEAPRPFAEVDLDATLVGPSDLALDRDACFEGLLDMGEISRFTERAPEANLSRLGVHLDDLRSKHVAGLHVDRAVGILDLDAVEHRLTLAVELEEDGVLTDLNDDGLEGLADPHFAVAARPLLGRSFEERGEGVVGHVWNPPL